MPRTLLDIYSFFYEQCQALRTLWGATPCQAVILCTRRWPDLLVQGRQPRLERRFFRPRSLPFPLPSQGRGTRPWTQVCPSSPTWLQGEGLVIGHHSTPHCRGLCSPHVVTRGRPSYRAPLHTSLQGPLLSPRGY